MRENRPEEKRHDVLYVYDRVCKKESKTRQILQEYGSDVTEIPNAQPNRKTERPFGREFAESQKKRAEEALRDRSERVHTASKSAWTADDNDGTIYTDNAGNEYIYRPASVRGGEVVTKQPLQFIYARIVDMFESLESRRKSDEETAKRQAIAHKKFTENRHALITALLLLLVTALFITFVYFAFFVISDVTVEGSDCYTDEEVIESAGFSMGDNLYSFHAGQAEELILFGCPELKTAQISRTVPNSVSITVTEDTAVFYADIYGDCAVLSSSLRVLGYTDFEDAAEMGLTKLVLPAVRESVAGRVLSFVRERDLRYVRNVIGAAEESLLYTEGRIDKIDVSDEYNIRVICDGMYILKLGGEKDSDLKLRMAYKTIGDSSFDREIPASIDLGNFSESVEASVRYDMRLIVD